MKTSELRQIIREEVRKVINEETTPREISRFERYFFGYRDPKTKQNRMGEFENIIRKDIEKLPDDIGDEWDELIANDWYSGAEAVHHIPKLKFYVKHKQYFKPKVVQMAQDILKSGELKRLKLFP